MTGVLFRYLLLVVLNVIHWESSHALHLNNPRLRRSLIHDLQTNEGEPSQSVDVAEFTPKSHLQQPRARGRGFSKPSGKEPREILKPRNYERILEKAKQFKGNESGAETGDLTNVQQGRGATSDTSVRWKYEMLIDIETQWDADKREEIESAIWTLKEAMGGCFKFKINPQGQTVPAKTKDYLEIKYGGESGCSSKLGRIGGKQQTTLSDACVYLYGTAMHEIMHVLGFFHEHVRPDRDKYVQIDFDNPELQDKIKKKQYDIRPNQLTFLSYDFESIMHYHFDEILSPIVDIPENVEVGQRDHLSEGDITRLRKLYPCSKAPNN